MATTDQRLAAAMAAASAGLRIVILNDHNGPEDRRKIPVGKGWGHKATDDEDSLVRRFEKRPDANLGVLLGKYPPGSKIPGVIDIEFDTPEGRATADKLFGKNTFTPTYESERSVHRLFLWNDSFPPIQKLDLDGLEVRLGGGAKQTQSVLPPSTHANGKEYRWLPGLSIDEVELAEVPESLAVQFCNVESRLEAEGLSTATGGGEGSKPPEYWESIKDGVAEGSRNEKLTEHVGRKLANLNELNHDEVADLKEWAINWGRKCSPPLPPRECESVVRSIASKERKRRADEASGLDCATVVSTQAAPSANSINDTASDPTKPDGLMGCELVLVDADPVEFRFRCVDASSTWLELPEWPISLPTMQKRYLAGVKRQFPPTVGKRWKSLVHKLCQPGVMRIEKPEAENNVAASIASLIVPKLRRVRVSPARYECQSRIETDAPGSLIRVADSVWVMFDRFHSDLVMEGIIKELTRKRLSAVLSRAGAVSAIEVIGDGDTRTRRRFWRIDDAILAKLEAIAVGDE